MSPVHKNIEVNARSSLFRYAAKFCSMMLALLISVSPAAAGVINLYSSPGSCGALEAPGPITVYVEHDPYGNATAVRFKLEPGPGMTMTYVSEVHYLPRTFGDAQTGMTVCYNGCIGAPVVLAAVTYMRYGTSADCSTLRVVPYPGAETVEGMDCNFQPRAETIRDFLVSTPSAGCGCPSPRLDPGTPLAFDCTPLAIEQTTWGRIKALYR